MGIVIKALDTIARVKREAAASGGVRSMVLSALHLGSEKEEKDENGNIIGKIFGGIWNGIKGLLGFIWKGLQFLGFGFAALVRGVFGAVRFMWNYNWRESLATINQATQERFWDMAEEWGGFVGRLFGNLICGALPGAVIFRFNPAIGLFILKEFGEDKLDEFLDDIDDIITITFKATLGQGMRYLLYGVRFLATPIVEFLFNKAEEAGLLPAGTAANTHKFLNDSEPWTFAKTWDNLLKSIPGGENVYDVAKELFDEMFEACFEAGVMIAEFADLGMAQSAMHRSYTSAPPATVTIDFDYREESPAT